MSRLLRGLAWLRRAALQKVRLRLTLSYAVLFLGAGSVLLGVTYGLVASSLASSATTKSALKNEARFAQVCSKSKQGPVVKRILPDCKLAFIAGAKDQRGQTLHRLLVVSFAALGGLTVASGGLGWVMAGRVLRPVAAITGAARRASNEHLGERLALTGPQDELKQLADTFDEMLDRLDAAFAAERRFVADASHELRTPLTVMRTAIDVTLAKPARTPAQLAAMAARVRGSIDHAEKLIEALLTLAMSNQGITRREFLDLATAGEDALDLASGGAGLSQLRIDSSLEPAEVIGDRVLLERLVGNLVDNAAKHNVPGGWIRVRTGREDGAAFFQIANSGPHVPEDEVASLFEPFRRLEGRIGSPGGAGLGLSIVRSIAKAHGASVIAHCQPEGGLIVSVVMDSNHDGERAAVRYDPPDLA